MAATEPFFDSITELARRLATGQVTALEITEATLARIEEHDDPCNAYITVTAERALDRARAADAESAAGKHRGPLHGVPVAIKDLYPTRGVLTTYGSPLFADWVPDFDAAVVERLEDAGAIVLGKTNLHELAYGTTSNNVHYGPVRNPWDRACHTGGSSGGSAAAVAAGLAYGALGSDTGASIRQPAHCCGIVGLKPTFGRVSKYRVLPLAWSMDHVGPLTRTVADAALMLQVLAGHDPRDACSVSRPVPDYRAPLDGDIGGLRIGVARGYFFDACDSEVVDAVDAAIAVLGDLGARVEEVALPDMEAVFAAATVTIASEAAAYHAADLRQRPESFSAELKGTLETAAMYTAVQYIQAQRLRRLVVDETLAAMLGLAAVVTPTSPVPATPIDDTPPAHGALRHRCTMPFNFTGQPAISVPCGFTAAGLPIGLQIVGQPFDEAGVLRLAHAYEQATPWRDRHPGP